MYQEVNDYYTDHSYNNHSNIVQFPSKTSIDKDERFWYLASPFTKYPDGLEIAYRNISRMLALCMENGIFVYSPIAHVHGIGGAGEYISGDKKLNYKFMLDWDFKFLKMSRGMIVCKMEGWENSFGIRKEIELAKELNLPIFYTEFMEVPKELT